MAIKKNKGGRPSKFSPEMQRQAKILAQKKGFTIVEIAEVLGVDKGTLFNWQKEFPKFFNSLKDWKKIADRKVERSLYERACGYSHPAVHVSNYKGEITITDIIKHYPPDPASMIFWLKNRQPDNWKDRVEYTDKLEPVTLNLNFGGIQ